MLFVIVLLRNKVVENGITIYDNPIKAINYSSQLGYCIVLFLIVSRMDVCKLLVVQTHMGQK